MNKRTWFFIILGLVVSAAVGFYIGIKYDKPLAPEDYYIAQVDSLINVNNALVDSLSSLRVETTVVTKDIIKYKTRYDTIRVSQNTNELLANLKTIISTPIE